MPWKAAALTVAKGIVVPGGRIFLRDLDTHEWSLMN